MIVSVYLFSENFTVVFFRKHRSKRCIQEAWVDILGPNKYGDPKFCQKLSNHCLTTNHSVGFFEAEEEILIITFSMLYLKL
jgi:hypothetical protein